MHLPRKIIQYLLHQTLSSVAQYGLCGGLHAQQSSMSSRTLLLVTVGLLALISLASANGKNWALLVVPCTHCTGNGASLVDGKYT